MVFAAVLLCLLCFVVIPQVQPVEDYRVEVAVKRNVNKPRNVFIESHSFEELVKKSDVFIDRTLLIRDVLTNTKKLVFITAPPKFGKSLNLDMIKTFVSLHLDEKGQQLIDTQYTFSYQFFKYGKVKLGKQAYERLEHSPLISRHVNIFLKYHGQYPVISVNFTNLTGFTFHEVIASVKERIRDAFKPHRYILSIPQPNCSDYTRLEMDRFHRLAVMDASVRNSDVERSIGLLSILLARVHQKCVYIFIDNMDEALDMMFRRGFYSSEDERFIINFFERFYKHTFRDNVNYNKGILTGTYQFTRKFYSVYKVPMSRYTALYNPLYPYFGYSAQHVALLCEHAGIEPGLAKQAVDWYKGYAMGINETSAISNPYSVLQFIRTQKIDDYWEQITHQSVSIRNMFTIPSILETFQQLLHGDITTNLNYLNVTRIDITYLNRILNEKDDYLITDQLYKLAMFYLIDIGYLTFNGFRFNNAEQTYFTRLCLPNQERRQQVRLMLRWYYIRKQKLNAKNVDKTSSELTKIVRGNDTDFTAITDQIQILFEDIRLFVSSEQTSANIYHIDHAIADATLNFLALNMRFIHDFEVKVNHRGCNMTVYGIDGRAGVIQFGFQAKSVDDLVRIAETQHDILNQSVYPINRIRFIGINVLFDKKIQIRVITKEL